MTACLQLTEATLAYPTAIREETEEITLWGPETIHAMPGAAAFMRGENAYNEIGELADKSGMFWDSGPYCKGVREAVDELNDPKESIQDPEIAEALDQWRAGCDTMDDLHEASYFVEWNQGEGGETWVGGDWSSWKNGKIPQYTPEMLEQRDALNWMFNFHWNTTFFPGDTMTTVIPEQYGELELVSVGENHGVAKCPMGSVFVPRGVLRFLGSKAQVGQEFSASLEFVEGSRYPWRVVKNSVQHIN